MSADKIRVEEVSKIISDRIKNFGKEAELQETGTVLAVGDGIARIFGLEGAMAGELVEFSNGTRGVVLNLEEDNVGAALFGEAQAIGEGDEVRRTGRIGTGWQAAGEIPEEIPPILAKIRAYAAEYKREIDFDHRHHHALPDLHHVSRRFHELVAELAHVDQPVLMNAHIHERAERCDVRHDAGQLHALIVGHFGQLLRQPRHRARRRP